MTENADTERPRLADFEARLGEPFTVTTDDGASAGAWKLESCQPLAAPDVPALRDADCFTLVFACENPGAPGAQQTYRLAAADGFSVRLFAVPAGSASMCATIN